MSFDIISRDFPFIFYERYYIEAQWGFSDIDIAGTDSAVLMCNEFLIILWVNIFLLQGANSS